MNNGSESCSRKRVGNAKKYKKHIKSWIRVPQVSAGSARKRIGLSEGGRDSNSNGSSKTKCKLSANISTKGFSEYWVPVRLSNVQIELYCAALLSKSTVLCSSRRNGLSDSLHELLVLERECCDHPYLVNLDYSLRRSLTTELSVDERLNAEIKMSGKLQLLEKCLLQIKERGLRVLIIVQPYAVPGTISSGDVLDDFVLQRFGKDSYVRIGDRHVDPFKKQAALDLFNKNESSSFVFLLEQRACLPSIKISSVDVVILFNSDWDPLNDLIALKKISFQSHFQQLKVFRLYSLHTVEEKLLMLAKQGLAPENLMSTSQHTCHTLLTWGALHQFDKLDQFHVHKDSNQNPSLATESYFFDDVVSEFSALLPNNRDIINPNTKYILKVQQTRGSFMKNAPLHGELEDELIADYSLIEKLMNNESSNVFWDNLLKGRCPRWRFLQHMDERKHTNKLPEETQAIKNSAGKIQIMVDSASTPLEPVLERKRNFCADQTGNSSTVKVLGRLPCKKSKSFELQQDQKAVNGKIGPSQAKKVDCILRNRVVKRRSYLRKNNRFRKVDKPTIRDLPVSELRTEAITKQTHFSTVRGSKGQEPQVPTYQSLEDSAVPAPINQRPDVSNSVSAYDSLEDTIMVDDFDISSIFQPNMPAPLDECLDLSTPVNAAEPFPRSQNTGTSLTRNPQLAQVSHISLGGPHPTLIDPQKRDLEIMQEIVEQALKIKQDTKSLLRAEFEKEIDQVTRKYVKLLEDVETELPQMRSQLRAEFEKVIDQVTRKYVKLLEDVETELPQMVGELETYNKKVKESKSLVPDVTVKQKGVERNDQRGKKSFALSRCATTTKSASSPKSYLSPPMALSSVVLNPAVPTYTRSPITAPSPPLSNPLRPIYQPQILHTGNIRPVLKIRAMAPHLRCIHQPAHVSPVSCSQTQNERLIGSRTVNKTTSGSTDLGNSQANCVSSMSTSDILSQLFNLP